MVQFIRLYQWSHLLSWTNNHSCRLFAVPYFFVRSSGLSTNSCIGTVGLLGFLCHYGIPPISSCALLVKLWVPIWLFACPQRMPTWVTSFDVRMKRKLIVSSIQLRQFNLNKLIIWSFRSTLRFIRKCNCSALII